MLDTNFFLMLTKALCQSHTPWPVLVLISGVLLAVNIHYFFDVRTHKHNQISNRVIRHEALKLSLGVAAFEELLISASRL